MPDLPPSVVGPAREALALITANLHLGDGLAEDDPMLLEFADLHNELVDDPRRAVLGLLWVGKMLARHAGGDEALREVGALIARSEVPA